MTVTATQNNPSVSIAISTRNAAHNIPDLAHEVYNDFIDDTSDYDEPS